MCKVSCFFFCSFICLLIFVVVLHVDKLISIQCVLTHTHTAQMA